MKICDNHKDKKPVPLLWTFRFDGSEYWCPACGYNEGMFGAGVDVDDTDELEQSLKEWQEKSRSFLSMETDEWEYIY